MIDMRLGRIHLILQRDMPRFKIENTRGRNLLPNWKRRCMKLMRKKFREGRADYDFLYGPIVWGDVKIDTVSDLNTDVLVFKALQTGTMATDEAA